MKQSFPRLSQHLGLFHPQIQQRSKFYDNISSSASAYTPPPSVLLAEKTRFSLKIQALRYWESMGGGEEEEWGEERTPIIPSCRPWLSRRDIACMLLAVVYPNSCTTLNTSSNHHHLLHIVAWFHLLPDIPLIGITLLHFVNSTDLWATSLIISTDCSSSSNFHLIKAIGHPIQPGSSLFWKLESIHVADDCDKDHASFIDTIVLGRVDLNQWVQSTTIQSLLFITYNKKDNKNNTPSDYNDGLQQQPTSTFLNSFTLYPTQDYHNMLQNTVVFDIPANREYMQMARHPHTTTTSSSSSSNPTSTTTSTTSNNNFLILTLDTSDPTASIPAELYFFSTNNGSGKIIKRMVLGTGVMQAELAMPLSAVFT